MLNEITFIPLQKNQTHKYIVFILNSLHSTTHHKVVVVVEERKKEEKKSNKVIFSSLQLEGEKKEECGWRKIFFPAYGWHFVCLHHHHVSSSFSR